MGKSATGSPGLAGALFTSVQQRVLGLLMGQPDRDFSTSEVIRHARGGTGAVHRELSRLAAAVSDHVRRPLLLRTLHELFGDLSERLQAMAAAREASPADLDAVAACGELLSSRIVATALASGGLPAVWVDSRKAIVTDAQHTHAVPQIEATEQAVEREIGEPGGQSSIRHILREASSIRFFVIENGAGSVDREPRNAPPVLKGLRRVAGQNA